MQIRDLFLVILGIGLGYLLMNYVSAIADNAVLFGVVLVVVGVVGAVMVKK